jgi:hypothetical protein
MIDFKQDIDFFLSNISKQIKTNMGKVDAVASGVAIRNVDVNSYASEGDLITVDYIHNLETGTPPKNLGGGVAFPEILKWVQFKNIGSAKYETLTAGRITKSINEKGTLLYQRGGRTTIFTDLLTNERTYDPLILAVQKTTLESIKELFKNVMK